MAAAREGARWPRAQRTPPVARHAVHTPRDSAQVQSSAETLDVKPGHSVRRVQAGQSTVRPQYRHLQEYLLCKIHRWSATSPPHPCYCPYQEKISDPWDSRLGRVTERRRARPSPHVLFALGNARRGGEGDSRTRGTSRSCNDSAVYASDARCRRRCDSPVRSAHAAAAHWRHCGNG